jgi:hypothetical protein
MIQSYGVHGAKVAWLGVDPGITTGWVILHDDGRLIGSGTFEPEVLAASLDHLVRELHRGGYCIEVVVEQMPRTGGVGALARALDSVWQSLYGVIDSTYELPYVLVSPSRWKPSRVARLTEIPGGFTVHQADALRMTRYEMNRRKTQ